MSTIAECLEHVRQCEWYAARTHDEQDRKFLLRKAKEWTKLAARERDGNSGLCAGGRISPKAEWLSNLGTVASLIGRTIQRSGGAGVKLSVRPRGGKPQPDDSHIKTGLTVFFVVSFFRQRRHSSAKWR